MEIVQHAPRHVGLDTEKIFSDRIASGECIVVRRKTLIYPPPCTSAICEIQYRMHERQKVEGFTYSNVLRGQEADALLERLIAGMKKDQEYLQKMLLCYGNALLDWWRRRRPAGRKAFLEQVVSELASTKETEADYDSKRLRPEELWITDVETTLKARAADRKNNRLSFLVPYLNTPNLAEQSFTLLALLHARVNSRPEDWARFDNDQFASTWACGNIDVTFNPDCVVLFGPDYGRLLYRDAEKAHRADMIGFPRDQLLIEAQATLMGLLKRIMEKAIERVGPGLPEGTNTLDEFVRATRASSHTSTAWASYLHQATSDPPNLDLPAMVSEVRARLSDIGGHLWLMQTEPVYLRRHFRAMGQTSAADTNRSTDWGTGILVAEVKAILDRYWFWQGVLAELEHAYVIYGQFQGGISPGSPLPKKVGMALGALEALLLQGIDLRSRQLYALITERPAFSNMYEHVYEEETKSTIKRFKQGPEMPTEAGAYKTHRLWWCLQNLLGEYDLAARHSIPMLLSMLDDHLSSASAQERPRAQKDGRSLV